MKRLTSSSALLILIALSLAFAACDDNKDANEDPTPSDSTTSETEVDPGIRTEKGLTVAAVNAGFGGGGTASNGDQMLMPGSAGSGGSGSTGGVSAVGSLAASQYGGDSASNTGSVNAQAAESSGGLTVTGYGTATAPADSAIIEFYFNTNNNYGCPGSSPTAGPRITEKALQPVADALIAVGVAADDIEFVSQGYYDACYSAGTIRAISRDVATTEAIAQAVVDAVTGVGNGITLSSTNITYTLQNCDDLEAAASRTAAEDAADNADRLATALGVSAGSITAASDYSYPWYYPYFGAQTCGSSYYGPIVYYAADGITGSLDDQPKEVQVMANINVTYAIN